LEQQKGKSLSLDSNKFLNEMVFVNKTVLLIDLNWNISTSSHMLLNHCLLGKICAAYLGANQKNNIWTFALQQGSQTQLAPWAT